MYPHTKQRFGTSTVFSLILIATIVIVILAIALAGGFFVYVYWWLVQRPVPKLDGTINLDCLAAAVEVLYDKHGIPHVYASSEADMFRAQGFLHAQHRLWQMEQSRRTANGTLAEVFGEAALEADRFSRIIGFRRAAEKELNLADNETKQVLAWYTEGINAFVRRKKGTLAAEFNLLRFSPKQWTPLDCVALGKVMNWALSINWESELTTTPPL